jgi:hypothetical protein
MVRATLSYQLAGSRTVRITLASGNVSTSWRHSAAPGQSIVDA